VIIPCDTTEDQFILSFFLVPKSDGNYRLILNLKKLNVFVRTEHFKLEDLRAAYRILVPGACVQSTIEGCLLSHTHT